MDMSVSSVGPQIRDERVEVKGDVRIQSSAGFEGVKNTAAKQIVKSIDQSSQSGDVLLRSQAEFGIDRRSNRMYLRVTNPKTGEVDKYPSEAQLEVAAAIQEMLDKEEVLPGELLNAKV